MHLSGRDLEGVAGVVEDHDVLTEKGEPGRAVVATTNGEPKDAAPDDWRATRDVCCVSITRFFLIDANRFGPT